MVLLISTSPRRVATTSSTGTVGLVVRGSAACAADIKGLQWLLKPALWAWDDCFPALQFHQGLRGNTERPKCTGRLQKAPRSQVNEPAAVRVYITQELPAHGIAKMFLGGRFAAHVSKPSIARLASQLSIVVESKRSLNACSSRH